VIQVCHFFIFNLKAVSRCCVCAGVSYILKVGGGRKVNISINIVALTSLPLCNLALSLESEMGVVTRLGVGI